MGSIRERVAALEVHTGAKANPVHSAAYERIFAALRDSLAVVSPTYRYVDCGTYNAVATDNLGGSFEKLITGMHRRIQDSALTADDRRVLAALPVNELKITCSSPESIVSVFGKLFHDY